MRRTKIVATLGPATDSPDVLDAIILAGVDVVRLNAAHSTLEELDARLAAALEAASRMGRTLGVLVDLPGPKVRVGEVVDGTVLEAGAELQLVGRECIGDATQACVTHRGLATDVSPGDRILIDDGRIELEVVACGDAQVTTRVVTGGPLVSNKGVNVPSVTLSVAPITPLDERVVGWAQSTRIDWVGQSFVRSAADVEALRALMVERPIPIVAKIEKHEAAGAIDSIVAAADGVMVARGDLGVETSVEQVPVLQRAIVSAARAAGKPVIVATEMLDSMRTRPRPTRAEASDVAGAIFIRTDAVMLSGETAVGAYPVEAVDTMARIITTAEDAWPPPRPPRADSGDDVQRAVSAVVTEIAADLHVAAIVTLTQSGATSLAVSRYRPDAPIIAATPDPSVASRLALVWGVKTLVVEFSPETSVLLDNVTAAVRDAGFAQPGQRIAITAGLGTHTPGGTDFLHVRTV